MVSAAPTRRAQRWAAVPLVILAVSMGLTWDTTSSAGGMIPGYYVPDSYVTVYDSDGWASTETIPGWVGAPIFTPGALQDLPGYATPARVWLICAMALGVAAIVRGRRRLMLPAAGAVAAAVLLTGVHLKPGVLLGVVAAGLLVVLGLGKGPLRRAGAPPGA